MEIANFETLLDHRRVTKTDSVCRYSKVVFWGCFLFYPFLRSTCPCPYSRTKKIFLPAASEAARASLKIGQVAAFGHALIFHSLDRKAPHMTPACWPESVPVSTSLRSIGLSGKQPTPLNLRVHLFSSSRKSIRGLP